MQTSVRIVTDPIAVGRPNGSLSPARRAVIYSHGAGGGYQDAYGPIISPTVQKPLVDVGGRTVYSPNDSGDSFGNDTGIANTETARLAAVADGFPSKVHLVGYSMGGLTSLNYAARYPQNVASIFLFSPATDLAAIYPTNTAVINTAYGGASAYLAALPTHSPILQWPAFSGIPIGMMYCQNDTTVPQSSYQAFISTCGPKVFDGGPLAHFSFLSASPTLLADWFDQHEGS